MYRLKNRQGWYNLMLCVESILLHTKTKIKGEVRRVIVRERFTNWNVVVHALREEKLIEMLENWWNPVEEW